MMKGSNLQMFARKPLRVCSALCTAMAKQCNICLLALAVLVTLTSCGSHSTEPQVEGHYTYEHAFSYDLNGSHFDVHETGTMDFYDDGTALDSALQVYTVTLPWGGKATCKFNYVSPSRWHLDADTFFFSGIKEDFRMEAQDIIAYEGCDMYYVEPLAQEIIDVVGGSIDYQYKFHIDSLTADKMQWSFTYRDGHSDTWEFFR